ncbi:MAG: alpha/beta hydrolase [Deltaproteobacteria bacterium]|nr:alpha/beta hydrolase [Deltaproteobacteria bacterium]
MKRQIILTALWTTLSLILVFGCTIQNDGIAVSSDGVKISYEEQGKGSRTLVFVHGWSSTRDAWDAQVAYFSKEYKVVTMDLAGFGKSGNDRKLWTMAAFGEDVAAVIKKLNLKEVVLVGFSMGGLAIIEAANRIPDHIAGLVLVDVLQDIEAKYSDEFIRNSVRGYMDAVTAPGVEKAMPFFMTNSHALAERYVAMVKDVPKTGWNESLTNCFRWINEDCIEALKNCAVPIVAINSDQDPTNVPAFRKSLHTT